jgi:AcrR family transcriptional regulator
MTRSKQKPEITTAIRDSMLDAATRVFAKKGYAAATMKDIATEAGYSAPAFYNYFKGKEELFEALAERTTNELLACFEGPPASARTFEQRVEVLTRRIFAQVDRRGETFGVLEAVQNGHPGASSAAFLRMQAECGAQAIERLCLWFTGAKSTKKLGQDNPHHTALFYLGVVKAFHGVWLLGRSTERFEDQTELVVDLFLHGISGQSTPPKARKRTSPLGAKK